MTFIIVCAGARVLSIVEENWGLPRHNRKYETEKENLAELIKLRNEARKEEILEAVIKSPHSYEEIMAFIKGGESDDE